MVTIESGKTISLNYTGKFDDGHVFDSSLQEGRSPLSTVLGNGNLIPGFEKGLLGLKEGEKKTIEVEPTEGYGEYQGPKGTINVTVKEITTEGVKLDANHPLAGKKLIFEVEVLEIK